MKKRISVILCVITGVMIPLAMMSACGNYTPASTEHYFRYGDVYRVFAPENVEPKHVEKYAIHSLTIPMSGSTLLKAEISEGFTTNCMFFSDPGVINKDGVIALYDYLDISSYALTNEYYSCFTTGIFTYNQKVKYATMTSVTVDMTDKPSLTVIGEVADVDIYTFDYEDRAISDGSVVKTGGFDIIVSGFSYVDTFIAYQ